jgi:hypothetical protein
MNNIVIFQSIEDPSYIVSVHGPFESHDAAWDFARENCPEGAMHATEHLIPADRNEVVAAFEANLTDAQRREIALHGGCTAEQVKAQDREDFVVISFHPDREQPFKALLRVEGKGRDKGMLVCDAEPSFDTFEQAQVWAAEQTAPRTFTITRVAS